MDVVLEEDKNNESKYDIVKEQANKLFELCDIEKRGYIFHEDLQHLDGLIPNLTLVDINKYFPSSSNKKTKFDRNHFIKFIEPLLLQNKTPINKTKKKQIKDISKTMFKTISLHDDVKKIATKEDAFHSTKPRLSISLDEKLGDFNLLNTQNSTRISKTFASENDTLHIDSTDFDELPLGSPFFDKTFDFNDDQKFNNISLRKRAENEIIETEKRNHCEVEQVFKRSKINLLNDNDNVTVRKLSRPTDFGPICIIDHTEEDIKTPDRIFKIVFVGDSAVGKTCFLHRFCHNRFKPLFNATIGVDFTVKSIKLRDKLITVQLWDTAGQERFRSITKQYFRKADSVVLLYDVTSEQSFLNVRNWIESVRNGVDDGCVMCLVGNKIDLISNETARKVTYSDGKRIAQEFDMLFFETSAYTGLGINDCMRAVAMKLQQREDEQLEEALRLEMTIQNTRQSWCCV